MATDGALLRLGVKSVWLTWCAVLFQWKPRWLHVHRGAENCWRLALGMERTDSVHLQTTDRGCLQSLSSKMPMTASAQSSHWCATSMEVRSKPQVSHWTVKNFG